MGKTIFSKLLAVVIVILVLLVASGSWIIYETGQINAKDMVELQRDDELQKLSTQLEIHILQTQEWLTDAAAMREKVEGSESVAKAQNYLQKASQNIEGLLASGLFEEDKLKELQVSLKAFYDAGIAMVNAFGNSGTEEGNKFMHELDLASGELLSKLKPIFDKIEKNKELARGDLKGHLAFLKSLVISSFTALIIFIALGLTLFGRWLIASIESSAQEILASVEKLNTYGGELEGKSNNLNQEVDRQSSSLQETSSSVNEIAQMLEKSSHAAKDSSERSKNSTQVATRGKATVVEMLASIDEMAASNAEIMNEIKVSNEEISNIVNVISEIGEKTKVINDIVFQTKLLSFNASVEAARAGEHGSGFAIVAQEVGNLAAMSGKASKEISDMLDRSIKEVRETVDRTKSKVDILVANSQEKVKRGTETAGECGRTLDEILQNVALVNDMVQEIAMASSEQSKGVEEVTKAMEELDQTTHENKAIADENLTLAKSINSQSLNLNNMARQLMLLIRNDRDDRPPAAPVARASSQRKLAKVLPLPSRQKKVATATPRAHIKASGPSGGIPLADDPRFEEL